MASLEAVLQESKDQRRRLIATDGVFSMDGDIAKLAEICALAEQYDALVMVDDSHATGYLGPNGRGTVELCGVEGKVDLITTTFGKACGGASGGCISGRQLLIDLYRQRARPYLFSNTLAPAICGGTLKVLDLLEAGNPYKEITMRNAVYFRRKMEEAGFDLVKGETAIVPVMIYDEAKAVQMADILLNKGIYVIGFCYPVVPKGKARIRVQLSATHTLEDLDKAVDAFKETAKEMKLPLEENSFLEFFPILLKIGKYQFLLGRSLGACQPLLNLAFEEIPVHLDGSWWVECALSTEAAPFQEMFVRKYLFPVSCNMAEEHGRDPGILKVQVQGEFFLRIGFPDQGKALLVCISEEAVVELEIHIINPFKGVLDISCDKQQLGVACNLLVAEHG